MNITNILDLERRINSYIKSPPVVKTKINGEQPYWLKKYNENTYDELIKLFKPETHNLPKYNKSALLVLSAAIRYVKKSYIEITDFEHRSTRACSGKNKIDKDLSKLVSLSLSDIKNNDIRNACCRLISSLDLFLHCKPIYLEINNLKYYQEIHKSGIIKAEDAHDFINKTISYTYPRGFKSHGEHAGFPEIMKPSNPKVNQMIQGLFIRIALGINEFDIVAELLKESPEFFKSSDISEVADNAILTNNAEILDECIKFFEKYDPQNTTLKRYIAHRDRLYNINKLKEMKGIDIQDISGLSGQDFEKVLINQFRDLGYSAEETPASGDYGSDIIVTTKNESKISVQCKRFGSKVNLKAVQEVIGSLAHYACDFGIVITNNSFLNSAIKLADSNDIELWDGDSLLKFLAGDDSFSDISSM
jgi:Restriction endonuclease